MFYPNRTFPIIKGLNIISLSNLKIKKSKRSVLPLLISLNLHNPCAVRVLLDQIASEEHVNHTLVFKGQLILNNQLFGAIGIYRVFPLHGLIRLCNPDKYDQELTFETINQLIINLGPGQPCYADNSIIYNDEDNWE